METAKPKKEEVKLTPEGEKIVKKATLKSEKAYQKLMSKPKVELISYSMKMVIPTGNYANIQPEIVVRAGTVEEAHDYIAPHFNKLWKEYYLVSERRPEPAKPVAQALVKEQEKANQMPPASSVAFTKASQAIASCLSIEALDIIAKQIEVSVKLTPEDKKILVDILNQKHGDLSATKN
jgi:hypothetical protein